VNAVAKSREEHMCPACIASAALIAAGMMSTGGLTAFVVKKLHPKNVANEMYGFYSQIREDLNTKSDTHGKEQS
jgi:hypothetical protein